MRFNKIEPNENWEGYKKYKVASGCLINLEILFTNFLGKKTDKYNSLKKCIKIHKKVSNLKKINNSLKDTILVQLNALMILEHILNLNNQDFNKLLAQKILKETFMEYEKNILELLSNQAEQFLIQNFFEKVYLLINVQDDKELKKLIDLSEFHSNNLSTYAKNLSFPKNRAFVFLESMIFDLIRLIAREVDPLNKLKKLLDLI